MLSPDTIAGYRCRHPLLVLLAALGGCTHAPLLTTPTENWLNGEPVPIRIERVAPGALVTVTAERPWPMTDPVLHRSRAVFRADQNGVVDVATSAPVAGPWTGVDESGLFWSMRPAEGATDGLPDSSYIRVHADFDSDGSDDATSSFRLVSGAPGLIEQPLPDEFPGAFLVLPRETELNRSAPLPLIIVLGGSEGGDFTARLDAPAFASRGYAAIGLPYYNPPFPGRTSFEGLPDNLENIELSVLERVRAWAEDHERLDADRVALYGVSKGAEFVLAGASMIDGFAAVIAIVPSDVVWSALGPSADGDTNPSYAFRGEPLPFLAPLITGWRDQGVFFADDAFRWRILSQGAQAADPAREEAARIRVEDIEEPVFVAGGRADWLWDSGGMASRIKATRDAAGLQTALVVGAEAGHGLAGPSYTPRDPATARVRAETYKAMWGFIREHLPLDAAQR